MKGLRLGFVLLATAGISGAVGAWIATARHREPPGIPGNATRANDGTASLPPGVTMQRALTQPVRWGTDELGAETARALKDPAYLRAMIDRYNAEGDASERAKILSVLQSASNDDVLRLSRQLLAGDDGARRQDGLALLRAYPLNKTEARALLTDQIRNETDPAMLKQLVEMLTPAIMPSEDAAPVIEQLAALRRNPDPDVRASSVLQSVRWDKSGDLEDLLHTAILDSAPQVQQAAMAGIGAANVRSERLKDALFGIISNPKTGGEERNAAVSTLQNFALDHTEYAVYQLAAAETAEIYEQ